MQLAGLKLEPGIQIEIPTGPVGYISLYGNNFALPDISSSYNCAVYDQLGNLYLAASWYNDNNSEEYGVLSKFDSSGTLLWQKTLGSANPKRVDLYGLCLDGSNNIYITGRYVTTTSIDSCDMLLAKYDTDGNLQWQKATGTAPLFQQGNAIVADNVGNFYICGSYLTSPGQPQSAQMLIVKYNSSGVLQWQRSMSSSDNTNIGNSIALDSAGNLYVAGTASTPYQNALVKYNSSGVLQWQVGLYKSGGYSNATGIYIDSSDNIYVSGWGLTGTGGTKLGSLVKYNTSGVIQWKKQITGTSADVELHSVTVDSSGNIYAVGGNLALLIVKYNNSGVLQWQRQLLAPSITTTYGVRGLSVNFDNSSNKIIVAGSITNSAGRTVLIMAKLPLNGTPVGTYPVGGLTIQYVQSTFTDSTLSAWTASVTTLANAASAFTTTTTSLDSANATFTNTVKPIP